MYLNIYLPIEFLLKLNLLIEALEFGDGVKVEVDPRAFSLLFSGTWIGKLPAEFELCRAFLDPEPLFEIPVVVVVECDNVCCLDFRTILSKMAV